MVGTPQEPDEPRVLPGRAEHALVQELGSKVYETAVSAGWIDAGDPEYGKGTARRSAVDLLTEIGLLQYDPQAKRFIPVDPSAASDLLVVPLAQQGAELLAESARWNDTFSQLGQVFRGSMVSRSRSITEIQGVEAINRFIDTQLNDCRTEFLAAQPYGRRRATTLAQAEPRDLQALRRGVSLRTLYQHSARQSIATREYVAEVTAARRGDPHLRRVLQAAADVRPAHRADPGHREPRGGRRDPRQVDRGLPARPLRAGVGARDAVHGRRTTTPRGRWPPRSGR